MTRSRDDDTFHARVRDSNGYSCDLGACETAEEASLAAARFMAGDRHFQLSWKLSCGATLSCTHCGRTIRGAQNLRAHLKTCTQQRQGGGTAVADAAAAAGSSRHKAAREAAPLQAGERVQVQWVLQGGAKEWYGGHVAGLQGPARRPFIAYDDGLNQEVRPSPSLCT